MFHYIVPSVLFRSELGINVKSQVECQMNGAEVVDKAG